MRWVLVSGDGLSLPHAQCQNKDPPHPLGTPVPPDAVMQNAAPITEGRGPLSPTIDTPFSTRLRRLGLQEPSEGLQGLDRGSSAMPRSQNDGILLLFKTLSDPGRGVPKAFLQHVPDGLPQGQ